LQIVDYGLPIAAGHRGLAIADWLPGPFSNPQSALNSPDPQSALDCHNRQSALD
jgi:hypothetical protein